MKSSDRISYKEQCSSSLYCDAKKPFQRQPNRSMFSSNYTTTRNMRLPKITGLSNFGSCRYKASGVWRTSGNITCVEIPKLSVAYYLSIFLAIVIVKSDVSLSLSLVCLLHRDRYWRRRYLVCHPYHPRYHGTSTTGTTVENSL